MHPDTFYRLALSRVPQVGTIISRLLYEHFGSAEAVFNASVKDLRMVEGMNSRVVTALQNPKKPFQEATTILRFAERNKVQLIHYTDSSYPIRFKEQYSAPTLFYYRGTDVLQHKRTVAIVGTRQPTNRGINHTEQLIASLSVYDPLIISGLAYGIDICAHRTALKHNLSTVGVLGSGFDNIYPQTHRGTAQSMTEQGGLLSAYPHFIEPERAHFPARNRLVAMLADMIIVVESTAKGGSIITANMGLSTGKAVGAFPGRVGDRKSSGCNMLLKNRKTHLIESADDIAKVLAWHKSKLQNRQCELFQNLTETEQHIVSELGVAEGISINELKRNLNWSAGQLATELLSMECKGIVKVLPGHRYRLAY